MEYNALANALPLGVKVKIMTLGHLVPEYVSRQLDAIPQDNKGKYELNMKALPHACRLLLETSDGTSGE